jgi:hypothetical protein
VTHLHLVPQQLTLLEEIDVHPMRRVRLSQPGQCGCGRMVMTGEWFPRADGFPEGTVAWCLQCWTASRFGDRDGSVPRHAARASA